MYTELGKWLKIFRLNHGIRLYDMAKKFGYSSSFLSAIETGKKKAPINFFDIMKGQYELSQKESNELETAIIQTRKEEIENQDSIHLKIENLEKWTNELSFMFARKVNHLTKEQREMLVKILKEEGSV